ncbi:MAG TPA: hypothetical protein PLL23_01080 [Chitinophagaceae bacterium]|nr:hypothetical protein [Chitinophagaceae bacterium]
MKGVIFLLLILPFAAEEVTQLPVFKAIPAHDTDFMGEIDNGPSEVLPGCSWYCGGNVTGFKASSSLAPVNNISYSANKAHDFDITTAWVEGKIGHGIGEYIEYTIDMTPDNASKNLGITQIILANGYKKTKTTWQENARVKKLKMVVNGKPYGMLELLDAFEFQVIDIGKIMLPPRNITTIRFEIVEVYPGSKFQDTAISELLFDGVGVH